MIILYRDQQRSGNVFMEKRYRGYPPEVKKVPWMLYRREEQSAGPGLTGNELRSEMDYLRGLYPSAAKRKQVLAEEACDLLEYPGSPMYDEYPDREFLYRELLKAEDGPPGGLWAGQKDKDLRKVLLWIGVIREGI